MIFEKYSDATSSWDRYYYCQNANFNVMALTDSSGNVVERVQYDPYGKATVTVEQGQTATGNPYLFQGRRWDAAAGLYNFRNRFYSPELGRFVQRDAAGYVDGMSLYEFVGGRPVVAVDPEGEATRLLYPPTQKQTPPAVPTSEAPLTCCKDWKPWWEVLYGPASSQKDKAEKIGKCFWWEYFNQLDMGQKLIWGATGGSAITISGIYFKKAGLAGFALFVAGEYEALRMGGNAAEKCTSLVCTDLVAPVRVDKYRDWWNPLAYINPTYECWGCPFTWDEAQMPGSDGWVRKNR